MGHVRGLPFVDGWIMDQGEYQRIRAKHGQAKADQAREDEMGKGNLDGRRWTDEEDDAIRNSTETNQELAERLGRSVKSIENHRYQLKKKDEAKAGKSAEPAKAKRKYTRRAKQPVQCSGRPIDQTTISDAFAAVTDINRAIADLGNEGKIAVLEFVLESIRDQEN